MNQVAGERIELVMAAFGFYTSGSLGKISNNKRQIERAKNYIHFAKNLNSLYDLRKVALEIPIAEIFPLILKFKEEAKREKIWSQTLQPLIGGKDLKKLGLQEGPVMGDILKIALEWQLDGYVTTKSQALKCLKTIIY